MRPTLPSSTRAARSHTHVIHALAQPAHLKLLHAFFQVLYVPAALAHLGVYPRPDLLILGLLPHLVRGIEKSPLALDLLEDRAEGVVVIVHGCGGGRATLHAAPRNRGLLMTLLLPLL